MFNFIIVDPRNPRIPANTLGIEVTVPEIAAMCDLGNIDPQHGCGRGGLPFDPSEAAVEAAVRWPLPPDGATLATIRPDLDAFGAMARLALRAAEHTFSVESLDRIAAIAAADGNTATAWAPRPLPTKENPWPKGVSVDSRRELAAIAAICGHREFTDIAYRVACVAMWIAGCDEETAFRACGLNPSEEWGIHDMIAEFQRRVEAERADMITALDDGRIQIDNRGPFAIVRSAHRAATSLGQYVAPIAICFHPAFQWPSGAVTPKTTTVWAVPNKAAAQRVVDALNAAERTAVETHLRRCLSAWEKEGDGFETSGPDLDAERRKLSGNWGGNVASGIIGSPQGRESLLTEEAQIAILQGVL